MVISNAIGIPVIALLQGLVGLIGYLIIGVDQPIFWFVLRQLRQCFLWWGRPGLCAAGLIVFAEGENFSGVGQFYYTGLYSLDLLTMYFAYGSIRDMEIFIR